MGHWHLKHWKLGLASTASAVHQNILTAVQTTIRGLGLTDIASASVVLTKIPAERVIRTAAALSFPGVTIAPGRPTLNPMAGSNVQDDVVYVVHVTCWATDNQETTYVANLARQNLWLERIRKAFHTKRLSGVATVWTCAVEPHDVVLPQAYIKQFLASALTLKFTSRETR